MGTKKQISDKLTDPKRVMIDGDLVKKYAERAQKIFTLEVPELREILGVAGDKVPVLKVKLASLNDHIKAQKLGSKASVILYNVAKKIQAGEDVTLEDVIQGVSEDELDPKAYFEIDLFLRCVVEPKFDMPTVLKISEVLPDFINKTVSFIIGLNSDGGTT